MQPKISVIIPSLNVKKYIKKCIESVLAQTMQEMEIICVDAGSVDGTLEILERFAKSDKRVQIVHSDRKSYGHQVNIGIRQALGQYIALVDADDMVVETMYETLYKEAVRSNVDYAKGTARVFYTVKENIVYSQQLMQFLREKYTKGKLVCVPSERPDLLTQDNFLWYGIYKREFLKGIRLHESPGAAFQDLGGLLQTQMQAQKAVYLEESFYQYRQDNVSASQYNPRGFQFVWEEYTWAEALVAKAPDEWKRAFYRKWFLHTLDRYRAMAASGVFWEEAQEYIDLIQNKMKTVLAEKWIAESDLQENEKEDLKIFLVDGYGIFDKYQKVYEQSKDALMGILTAIRDKEVIIFGCGNYGKFLCAQMIRHGVGRAVAFCDNKAEMYGKSIWDIPVESPQGAVHRYPHGCFVIANAKYSDEMRDQLMHLGVDRNQIYLYTAGLNMYLFGM